MLLCMRLSVNWFVSWALGQAPVVVICTTGQYHDHIALATGQYYIIILPWWYL